MHVSKRSLLSVKTLVLQTVFLFFLSSFANYYEIPDKFRVERVLSLHSYVSRRVFERVWGEHCISLIHPKMCPCCRPISQLCVVFVELSERSHFIYDLISTLAMTSSFVISSYTSVFVIDEFPFSVNVNLRFDMLLCGNHISRTCFDYILGFMHSFKILK